MNPNCIGWYSTFPNSLQLPRTKDHVFFAAGIYVYNLLWYHNLAVHMYSHWNSRNLFFDSFWHFFDRQADHPTDRQMKEDIEAPLPELKDFLYCVTIVMTSFRCNKDSSSRWKFLLVIMSGVHIKLSNFALISLAILNHFHTFPGVGGWGKIKNKDHLNPAETKTGAEICNILCINVAKDMKLRWNIEINHENLRMLWFLAME